MFFNAAYMLAEEISQIYSWDRDFDKLDGITRVEPNFLDEKGSI
jgi:predicted nucleic acid-binding protein